MRIYRISLAVESMWAVLAVAAAGSRHLHHALEVLLPAEGAAFQLLLPVVVAGRDGGERVGG